MLTARDFHRAATYLLARYGDEAGDRAAIRTSALRDAGEAGLMRIWDVLFTTIRHIEKSRAGVAAHAEPARLVRLKSVTARDGGT